MLGNFWSFGSQDHLERENDIELCGDICGLVDVCELSVHTVGGDEVCRRDAPISWSGLDVKVMLGRTLGEYPISSQRLISEKTIILDGEVLSEHLRHGSNELSLTLVILPEHVVDWLARIIDHGVFSSADFGLAGEAIHTCLECVWAAVMRDGNSLRFADEDIRSTRRIVVVAVQQNGHALAHASEALRADVQIVMAAVQRCGKALQYACSQLRDVAEVVLVAVRSDGRALKYASLRLRGNRDIIRVAAWQDVRAFEYASDMVRFDVQLRLLRSFLRCRGKYIVATKCMWHTCHDVIGDSELRIPVLCVLLLSVTLAIHIVVSSLGYHV